MSSLGGLPDVIMLTTYDLALHEEILIRQ